MAGTAPQTGMRTDAIVDVLSERPMWIDSVRIREVLRITSGRDLIHVSLLISCGDTPVGEAVDVGNNGMGGLTKLTNTRSHV